MVNNLTEQQRLALSWCYSRAMDYVEKHSPIDNPYPNYTGRLDLIVNGVNVTETIKQMLDD